MRESSIAKHLVCAPGSPLARAIGREVRRRRLAAGLSQAEAGFPFSRAFISAVEHGHVLPSLASLFHVCGRLATDPATLLAGVNTDSTAVYNAPRGRTDTPAPTRRGGRPTVGGEHRSS